MAALLLQQQNGIVERIETLKQVEPAVYPNVADNLTFHFDKPSDLFSAERSGLVFKPAHLLKPLPHKEAVFYATFSPDNSILATTCEDSVVRLWNVPSGKLSAELKGHERKVVTAAFSPDGKSLLTGSADQSIINWSVASKKKLIRVTAHTNWVMSVAWAPNGETYASGSDDASVMLWNSASGKVEKVLQTQIGPVHFVSFSQYGNKLLSSSGLGAVVWDIISDRILIRISFAGGVRCARFSHDDKCIVAAGFDQSIYICDAANGQKQKRFHPNAVSFSLSLDESMIAVACGDNSVQLWDAASTKKLQQLDGHKNVVWCVAFSSDGKYIASACHDKMVYLWKAPSFLEDNCVQLLKQQQEARQIQQDMADRERMQREVRHNSREVAATTTE